MGAYEVQPAPLCPADVSPPGAPDGQVNIDDLRFTAVVVLPTPPF
jgi:hypothetical protein